MYPLARRLGGFLVVEEINGVLFVALEAVTLSIGFLLYIYIDIGFIWLLWTDVDEV